MKYLGINKKEHGSYRNKQNKSLITSVSIRSENVSDYEELRKFCSIRGYSIGDFLVMAYRENYQLDSSEDIRVQMENIQNEWVDREIETIEEVFEKKFSGWSDRLVDRHTRQMKKEAASRRENHQ